MSKEYLSLMGGEIWAERPLEPWEVREMTCRRGVHVRGVTLGRCVLERGHTGPHSIYHPEPETENGSELS